MIARFIYVLAALTLGMFGSVVAAAQVVVITNAAIQTSNGVVDTAVPGQVLDVLGRQENWLLVSRGKPGWIKSSDALPLIDAEKVFTARVRADSSALNHLAYGLVMLELGRHQKAIQSLRQAVQLEPEQSMHWEALGHAYLRTDEFVAAVAAFTQGISVSHDSESARMGRGSAYLELGKLELAMDDLTKALAADPTHAYALKFRGMVHLELANTRDALNDFNGAIKADPYDLHARNMRGKALCKTGAFQEAIKDFSLVLKRNTNDIDALTGHGIANHALGQLTSAKDDFRRAIELTPSASANDAYLWSNLGQVLMETGDYAGCLQHLEHAIALNPKFADAYGHRAMLRATCPNESFRNGSQAKVDALTYIQLEGRSFWTYRVVAATNAELGNFELAVRSLELATQLADDSVPRRFLSEANEWTDLFRSKRAHRLGESSN